MYLDDVNNNYACKIIFEHVMFKKITKEIIDGKNI